ncbi:MAG: hypothetical protein ABH821_00295 [archaeon]
MKKVFVLGLLFLILIIVSFSGCTEKEVQTQENQQPGNQGLKTNPETQPIEVQGNFKTCSELNGFECVLGQECSLSYLNASDSFSCCKSECVKDSDLNILTIEPFEVNPENEELGELT